ncbi:MAG: Hint domain-containing protein [Pseudomonadota bacterium]
MTTTGGGMVNTNFNMTTKPQTFGNNPIEFISNLAGVGLPGDTMKFTVSAISSFYSMSLPISQDRLALETSGGMLASTAIFEMRFDGGSGLTRLSNVSLNGGAGFTGSVSYQTTGGAFQFANSGTGVFAGPITAIRFTTTGGRLNSVGGTPTCFAKGTRIATPGGWTAVEDLEVGAQVMTFEGSVADVLWVGEQRLDFEAGVPDHLRPVRISAGALSRGVPIRDLVVTADHAILQNGHLVNAAALVNGTTIDFDTVSELSRALTVYHVETKDHVILLAEGAPAESYLDTTARSEFDNYAAYLALYGQDRPIQEAAYPRIATHRLQQRASADQRSDCVTA